MSSLRAPVQKLTHITTQLHIQHRDATGIKKKLYLCVLKIHFVASNINDTTFITRIN